MTDSDLWAPVDHDPTSNLESSLADPYVVQAINGAIIARYPDFAPGAPLRVLPAIVSNIFPAERPMIDDNWIFVGATRHSEYATIRHSRDNVTVTIERHRLRLRDRLA